MTIEATVHRPAYGENFVRRILCTVARIGDAADAVAVEMGFPSWEHYSNWCESPPILHTVRVMRST